MTDHLAIASLGCEIAGACWLAKGLAFGKSAEYVAITEQQYGHSLMERDVARARDMTDALVGIALVIGGIGGQVLGLTHWAVKDSCWWYIVLGVIIALSFLAWRGAVVLRQRSIVAARLRYDPTSWPIKVDDYEQSRRQQGQVRGDVLSDGLGRRWWTCLVDDLEQRRETLRQDKNKNDRGSS